MCNAVAWIHRAEGFGLSRKTSGTRGRRHDGQECCHDVVMLLDGRYCDILTAAGGASTPNWSSTPNGRITDPARGWVAPIVPQGQPEPPVPPPVDPPPQPPPSSDVEARLRALEQWRVDLASYVVRTGTGWPR